VRDFKNKTFLAGQRLLFLLLLLLLLLLLCRALAKPDVQATCWQFQ